jgi:hypothetical protein
MEPKIDPGPGYRLLAYGELILSGDEYYITTSKRTIWCPTNDVGEIHLGYVTRRRKVSETILEGF